MRKPFPFIVGCGRSGTTLLRAMLDSSRDMAVPPETRFVAAMARDRARYVGRQGLDRDRFIAELGRYAAFQHMGLTEAQVREAFASAGPSDCPEAIRTVFGLYASVRGKSRYASKTPRDVISIADLSRAFPDAVFLHIIRDGRAVALSFLSVNFGPPTITQAAMQWDEFVRSGMAAGRELGPQRYQEVRYEELIDDPERALRVVCPFVGLEFEPAMLRYHERHDQVMQGVANPGVFESLKRPPTKGIRDWRSQMTAEQARLFEAVAGDLLRELGYELSTEKVGVGTRAEAAARTMSLRAKRGVIAAARKVGLRR